MRKFTSDQRGMVIVEAVYVFPVVILITISLYFLTMFLYGRVSLQSSLTWYVEGYCNIARNSCVVTTLDFDESLISARNPYRTLFEDVTKGADMGFAELVGNSSQKMSPSMGVTDMQAKVEVTGLFFKEVVATASKTFVFPINLSFVGLPSEVMMSTSMRRPITDHEELIRNIDIAIDLSSYLDDKYGISDSIKEMMGKVSGFVSRIL